MELVINKINRFAILTTFVLAFVEMALFSMIDGIGALMFSLSWYILSISVFRYENVIKHTIPFFILFSYALCFFFLPLVCTLIEYKPLTYNFKVPLETFIHQFLFLMILILAFQVMKKMGRNKIRLFFIRHTNFFIPLDSKEVWFLGLIGILSFTFSIFAPETSFIGKITDGLRFLAAAPILLLFPSLYSGNDFEKPNKKTIRAVLCYTLIYIFLGMARNSRMAMLFLMIDATLILLIYLIIYNVPIKNFIKTKYLIGVLLGLYILSGPLSDIGIAMINVRSTRNETDPITLMENTWNFYQSPKFNDYKELFYLMDEDMGINNDMWSEYYIDHVFLNRLCNLRISDATLYYADILGYNNSNMQQSFYDQLLANLPAGLVSSQFKETTRYSAGDKLYSLATGRSDAIGGYRVAGYTGIGLATFGYSFYVISFFFYVICFYLLDAFSFNIKNKFLISIFALLHIDMWFYFLNNGAGILRNISYICRGYFQDLILFILMVLLVRFILKKSNI